MFRVIHPNRWFIWTLAFLLGASLILMFFIQSYLLELERGVLEQQTRVVPGWKTYRSQSLGLEVRYPFSWQIEIDPLEAHSFSLLNPGNFGENITFAKTDPKYEPVIKNTLKISSEQRIFIDLSPGTWISGSDLRDKATSNVILIKHSGFLYYIAGQAKQFEKIIKSIKFL